MIDVIKGYRDNASLRHSFNELAGKTFDLDFEDWYRMASGEMTITPILLSKTARLWPMCP